MANNVDELIKYKELLDEGLISQEQFDAKKAEVMSGKFDVVPAEPELTPEELEERKKQRAEAKKKKKKIALIVVVSVVAVLILAIVLSAVIPKVKQKNYIKGRVAAQTEMLKADLKVGDEVKFGFAAKGVYPGGTGMDDIWWDVIDVKDGKALLWSKYVLTTAKFNDTSENPSWETSSLRKLMNEQMFPSMFYYGDEASRIVKTKNPADPEVEGAKETEDFMFLLNPNDKELVDAIIKSGVNTRGYKITSYDIDPDLCGTKGCDTWSMATTTTISFNFDAEKGVKKGVICDVDLEENTFYGLSADNEFGVRPLIWVTLDK